MDISVSFSERLPTIAKSIVQDDVRDNVRDKQKNVPIRESDQEPSDLKSYLFWFWFCLVSATRKRVFLKDTIQKGFSLHLESSKVPVVAPNYVQLKMLHKKIIIKQVVRASAKQPKLWTESVQQTLAIRITNEKTVSLKTMIRLTQYWSAVLYRFVWYARLIRP